MTFTIRGSCARNHCVQEADRPDFATLALCKSFGSINVRAAVAWITMRNRSSLLLLTSFAISCFLPAQDAPSSLPSASAASPAPPSQEITLPDGTPIFLRFAQPVYGLMAASKYVAIKKGTRVRLVAGADVRSGGRIIIPRGSLAQATVTNVLPYGATLSNNGLTLGLDWVESITGEKVPLRPERSGDPVPFTIKIYSTNGGVEVVPHVVTRRRALADLGKFMSGWDVFRPKAFHERSWIPAGSRLHVFLHGDLTVSAKELDEAQADLPVQNLTATVYVFRTKDNNGPAPGVSCDQGEARSLGSQQSLVFDLQPGEHSCKVASSLAIALTTQAGTDYFLRLRQASGAWKLEQVADEEGEDRIAGCQFLAPLNPGSNTK